MIESALAIVFGTVLLVLIASVISVLREENSSTRMSAPPGPREGLARLSLTQDSELSGFIRDTGRDKDEYYHFDLPGGQVAAVGYSSDNDWVDVITRKKRSGEKGDGPFTGPYAVFGYGLVEGRWSYGEAPPAARSWRARLAESFGAKETGRFV